MILIILVQIFATSSFMQSLVIAPVDRVWILFIRNCTANNTLLLDARVRPIVSPSQLIFFVLHMLAWL